MMKVDYTTNKPQTISVPIMKSEEILGYLTVEYVVNDVVDEDYIIQSQVEQ